MEVTVNDLIVSANEYLIQLKPGIQEFCDNIRSNTFQELSIIADICDGIGWIIEASALISKEREISLENDTTVLQDVLSDITNALENRDYLFLADMLEYEVIPCIESIEGMIADFK